MEYAVITAPAAPVRRKPDHRKEMVNQLLFGETVSILKTKGPLWVKVKSLHDGYEGWLTNTLFMEVDETFALSRSSFVTTDLLSRIDTGDSHMHIPAGSSLPLFDNGRGMLGNTDYRLNGNFFNRDEQKPGSELLSKLATPWLDAPYLWGGRTPLGVDCSGFIQVIFKQMGIDLPRDAWQQAQEGKAVKKFRDAKAGDLAFFDRGEEIVHAGIILEEERMIHASGRVRIDLLDKKGVRDVVSGKRTLFLRAIRRIIS